MKALDSGRQIRIPNFSWEFLSFDVPYEFLGPADVQTIYGFYCARQGPWDSFLYDDPTDHNTVANAIAAGLPLSDATAKNIIEPLDGSTTQYQLSRSIGGSSRPVFDINGAPGMPLYVPSSGTPGWPLSSFLTVYFVASGVPTAQPPGNYTLGPTGIITFGAGHTPAAGVQVAADFAYFWRVRFSDDGIDISNFAQDFWESKKVSFEQVDL